MLTKPGPKKEIAARLKQARETAGYSSAEDFCLKNNLQLKQYLSYEKGNIGIKISPAVKYCKLLCVPIRWLLLGEHALYK